MNKKEFDRRISDAADDITSDWYFGICNTLNYLMGCKAKYLFNEVFYKQRPLDCANKLEDDFWLGPDDETRVGIRLEFLYRFWDYCVERKLYRKW